MGKTALAYGCLFIGLPIIIISVVLIAISFSKLSSNEVGLDLNKNTKTIDSETLYSNGVHFLGVNHEFIKFPKNVQEIDLRGRSSIDARTKDGLSIVLEARVLYRLPPDNIDFLLNLHLMFNGKHQSVYSDICRAIVRDVASQYTAFEFWQIREEIANQILLSLEPKLADYYARVDTFLLTNFQLPPKFRAAIDETAEVAEQKTTVENQGFIERKETDTRLLEANLQVDIIGKEANATATQTQLEFEAQVQATKAKIDSESLSYLSLKNNLGFSNEELVTFVWLDALRTSPEVEKTFNLKTPAALRA